MHHPQIRHRAFSAKVVRDLGQTGDEQDRAADSQQRAADGQDRLPPGPAVGGRQRIGPLHWLVLAEFAAEDKGAQPHRQGGQSENPRCLDDERDGDQRDGDDQRDEVGGGPRDGVRIIQLRHV